MRDAKAHECLHNPAARGGGPAAAPRVLSLSLRPTARPNSWVKWAQRPRSWTKLGAAGAEIREEDDVQGSDPARGINFRPKHSRERTVRSTGAHGGLQMDNSPIQIFLSKGV